MESNNKTRQVWLKVLRWTARVIALLFILFCLGMFFGEGGVWSQPEGAPPIAKRDIAILSLWALYLIGLIVGLWREGWGGLISLVFMIIHIGFQKMEGMNLPIFYILLIPGLLYLLSWYFHKRIA